MLGWLAFAKSLGKTDATWETKITKIQDTEPGVGKRSTQMTLRRHGCWPQHVIGKILLEMRRDHYAFAVDQEGIK